MSISAATALASALCFVLSNDGAAPEWIELIPAPGADGIVRGQDGRTWLFRNAPAVAANFVQRLPIDINHSTELKAPKGEDSPAVGWIEQLEARNGALWGRVSWTERGAQALNGREYRFVSPVFTYQRESTEIFRLTSAALVNNPNLPLALNSAGSAANAARSTALAELMNREIDRRVTATVTRAAIVERLGNAAGIEPGTVSQILRGDIEMPPIERLRGFARVLDLSLETLMDAVPGSASNQSHPEPAPMSLKAVLAALKLADNATEAEAVNAIHALNSQLGTALNAAQTPDLAKFVPRTDHDAALARASNAEAALNAVQVSQHQTAVNAAVDAAIAAGKLTPASREFYVATCATADGLAKFKTFVDQQPVVVAPGSTVTGAVPPGGQTTLTPEQKAMCAEHGIKEETFLSELKALNASRVAA